MSEDSKIKSLFCLMDPENNSDSENNVLMFDENTCPSNSNENIFLDRLNDCTGSNCLNSLDDYNFGVSDENMAINFVNIGENQIYLSEGEIKNPFFVSITGGTLSELSYKETFSTYKTLYVMCMRDNFTESDKLYKIYDPIVKIKDLKKIKDEFALHKAPMLMLRNFYNKNNCLSVDSDHLKIMFDDCDEIGNVLVLPMFELTESQALLYISMYDNNNDISFVSRIVQLSNYYYRDFKEPTMNQFSLFMNNLKEAQFWSDIRNCNINMTELFKRRMFVAKDVMHKNILASILSKSKKEVNGIFETEYLSELQQEPEKYNKSNLLTALKLSNKRTYFITNNESLKLTKDEVTNIILSIETEEELYHTFNNLLISKEYCHLVLNNSRVLDKVKPLLDKYFPIYSVLFAYAWASLTIEENILNTYVSKNDRIVFDIETASKLPSFPICENDLKQNPYFSVFVDDKLLDITRNFMSLNLDVESSGVCNLETFKWRLNLFISGNPDKNVFDGLNWENYAISGSVIPACLQKQTPLLKLLDYKKKEDKWSIFFDNYYLNSDIDMMCYDNSIFGYVNKVDIVVNTISKNCDVPKQEIEIVPTKTTSIIITKNFIEEIKDDFNDQNNSKLSVNEIIEQLGSDEFKQYLYTDYYVIQKKKFNKELIKESDKYLRIYTKLASIDDINIMLFANETIKTNCKDMSDSEVYLFTNDLRTNENKVVDSKNYLLLKIVENVKYKINTKKLKRSIEVFRSRTPEFFSVVAHFHLPCVRAYYTGYNVYLLPSNITAMQTGINIDYKYFASVRDPVEILNKYRMRGFGTLLSKLELEHVIEYNLKIDDENVKILKNTQHEIYKSLGFKKLSDKIYLHSDYEDKTKYIVSQNDLMKYYETTYQYDPSTYGFMIYVFKAIDKNGSPIPYKKWLSSTYYEMHHQLHNKIKKSKSDHDLCKEILNLVKENYESNAMTKEFIMKKFPQYNNISSIIDNCVKKDKLISFYDKYYLPKTQVSQDIIMTLLNGNDIWELNRHQILSKLSGFICKQKTLNLLLQELEDVDVYHFSKKGVYITYEKLCQIFNQLDPQKIYTFNDIKNHLGKYRIVFQNLENLIDFLDGNLGLNMTFSNGVFKFNNYKEEASGVDEEELEDSLVSTMKDVKSNNSKNAKKKPDSWFSDKEEQEMPKMKPDSSDEESEDEKPQKKPSESKILEALKDQNSLGALLNKNKYLTHDSFKNSKVVDQMAQDEDIIFVNDNTIVSVDHIKEFLADEFDCDKDDFLYDHSYKEVANKFKIKFGIELTEPAYEMFPLYMN